MAITGIDNQTLSAHSTPGSYNLDMSTFMQLLTVQLTTQNPLEPMNDRDFFAQMAQLGQVQGLNKMEGQLGDLGFSMNMVQASSLIGKTVTAERSNPAAGEDKILTGTVTKISIQNGSFVVTVHSGDKDIDIPMDSIQSVKSS